MRLLLIFGVAIAMAACFVEAKPPTKATGGSASIENDAPSAESDSISAESDSVTAESDDASAGSDGGTAESDDASAGSVQSGEKPQTQTQTAAGENTEDPEATDNAVADDTMADDTQCEANTPTGTVRYEGFADAKTAKFLLKHLQKKQKGNGLGGSTCAGEKGVKFTIEMADGGAVALEQLNSYLSEKDTNVAKSGKGKKSGTGSGSGSESASSGSKSSVRADSEASDASGSGDREASDASVSANSEASDASVSANSEASDASVSGDREASGVSASAEGSSVTK